MLSVGHIQEVKGEGMPTHKFPSERGSLFVEYKVDLPETLTPEQVAAIEKIFKY